MNGRPNPGKGWFFDSLLRDFREISSGAYQLAGDLISRGFVQVSARYRMLAVYDRTTTPWVEVAQATVTPMTFAAFRELRTIDEEHRAHVEREGRRPRAERIATLARTLPADRAVELILDLLEKYNQGAEVPYEKEVGYVRRTPLQEGNDE